MAQRFTAAQRGKLFLNAIRHSELARSLKVLPGALPYRSLRRAHMPLLIDIESRMGMGAILSLALRVRIQNHGQHEGIERGDRGI